MTVLQVSVKNVPVVHAKINAMQNPVKNAVPMETVFHCASLQTAIVQVIPAMSVTVVRSVKIKNVYQNVILIIVYTVLGEKEMNK